MKRGANPVNYNANTFFYVSHFKDWRLSIIDCLQAAVWKNVYLSFKSLGLECATYVYVWDAIHSLWYSLE